MYGCNVSTYRPLHTPMNMDQKNIVHEYHQTIVKPRKQSHDFHRDEPIIWCEGKASVVLDMKGVEERGNDMVASGGTPREQCKQ
eukprot:scaffold24982_cov65-Attheya_sp.AAC.2